MTLNDMNAIRNRLGEEKFRAFVDHARELKQSGRSPDDTVHALKARFAEIDASTAALAIMMAIN